MAWRLVARWLTAMVALCLMAGTALAQPSAEAKDTARELARQGAQSFVAGQYERAFVLFRRAYELVPAPSLAVREASAAERLGRLTAARRAYEKATATPVDGSSPPAYLHAVAEAKVELVKLDARMPHLVIAPDPADAGWTVEVNGEVVGPDELAAPTAVDPGPYEVRGSVDGRSIAVATGAVREGETRTVRLAASGASAADSPATRRPRPAGTSGGPDKMRVLAVVAAGGGVALLTVGAATGAMALSHHDDLERACVDDRCPSSAQGDLDAFHELRAASTIAYATGVLALGTGITLWVLAPSPKEAANSAAMQLAPVISLGSIGVRGTF